MRTVVDDCFSTFDRTQAADIGNALLGYKDHRIVFRMVGVSDHRHYAGDRAAFSGRRRRKNSQEAVAHIVAATADTIHHRATHNVGRIGLSIDIKFKRSVHCDNAQTPDNFGVITDIKRS